MLNAIETLASGSGHQVKRKTSHGGYSLVMACVKNVRFELEELFVPSSHCYQWQERELMEVITEERDSHRGCY